MATAHEELAQQQTELAIELLAKYKNSLENFG